MYALGVVLCQLLVGDFHRPVTTEWAADIADGLLRDDLKHCFAGKPEDRFAGAAQLAKNLRALPQRQAALAQQQATLAASELVAYRRGMMRTAGVAAVIVAVIAGLALLALRQSRRAEAGERYAQRLLYAANMNLAQQAWEQNNVGRVRQLLGGTAADPERGFEWYYWQRRTHLELRILHGHSDQIWGVAFSPDGRWIASGSKDRTAKVWEAASGKELLTLRGHSGRILSVAFSPDGRRIVTGSEDQTAKVWEATSGEELLTLKGRSDRVLSVAFSPDGQRIVTGSYDQTAKVWQAATAQQVASWQRDEKAAADRLATRQRE
jgi:hypothetical protein